MMLKEHYFWPCREKDVQDVIKRCAIDQMAKSHTLLQGLYTPLSVPNHQWEVVSVDFNLGLPWTLGGKDSILVVVDHFSKMSHFIPFNKTNDATDITDLYFKEVVKFHGIPRSTLSS